MYSMRVQTFKKWIAMAAAVSCVMGTGAFTSFADDHNNVLQSEADALSEDPLADSQEGLTETETQAEKTRISWWICPTGGYTDEDRVQAIVDAFEEANPHIGVDFRILDEKNGADEIRKALGSIEVLNGAVGAEGEDTASGADGAEDVDVPDVVLCAPEYIVTEWGNAGYMEDLSALWDEETQKEFRSEMRDTAKNREGTWYAVPLYRDLYSMAINYEMFEKAGVLQYLNEEVHSWKDSGFIDTVLRVHDVLVQEEAEREADKGNDNAVKEGGKNSKNDKSGKNSESGLTEGIVGKVYCKDEVGQRAFMCFVSNFFNAGLVDEYHSAYQSGRGKIRNVFSTLRNLIGKGIEFDSSMDGDDENAAFLRGDVFMTFNWSASKQRAVMENRSQADVQTDADFTIFPMMFPNSKNLPFLTGTIGSLGVVGKEEEEKTNAAVEFVRYLMTDENAYTQAVLTSGCFPARHLIGGHTFAGLYGDDETMKLYETLNEYYGDYEPMMELYPELEKSWPELVRQIGDGAKIKKVTTELEESLNEELREKYGINEIEEAEEEE